MEIPPTFRPARWLAGVILILSLLAGGCVQTDTKEGVDYGYGMDFKENPVP